MKTVIKILMLALFLQTISGIKALNQKDIEKTEQFGKAVETINQKLQNLSDSFNRQINDLQNRVSEVAVWAQELGQSMKDAGTTDNAVDQPTPPPPPVPLPRDTPPPLPPRDDVPSEESAPEDIIIKALKRLDRAQVDNARQAMDYLIGIKSAVKQPNVNWQKIKDVIKNLTQAKMYLLRFKKSFNTGVMLQKLYVGLGYTKQEQAETPLPKLTVEDHPIEQKIVTFLTRLDTEQIPTITQAINIVINMRNEVQNERVQWDLVQAYLAKLPRAQKELIKYKKDFNKKMWLKNLYDNVRLKG